MKNGKNKQRPIYKEWVSEPFEMTYWKKKLNSPYALMAARLRHLFHIPAHRPVHH